MFYREAGQYKTSYSADHTLFPILQDKIAVWAIVVIALVLIPLFGSEFFLSAVMIPFLVFSLAALGLNILMGYAGQLSLGTGAFMGVGAYSCYKMVSLFPNLNVIVAILLSGFFSAGVGIIFGLPSLRIKGLYLAITTLAAQFFLEWCFIRIAWLYNYNDSGAIEIPTRSFFGWVVSGPTATATSRYMVVVILVIGLAWIASNILRGRIGRSWMMIRDMDIAAELMGIRPLHAKLSAFAFSSFYCGVAGALMVFCWLGSAEVESFDINHSFLIMFMVIIGGLGSIKGCFLGAAFIWVFPILMRSLPNMLGIESTAATVEHLISMIIGALIIFFLIVEPHGLARLWTVGKEKMRTWPFPYA